MPEPEVKDSTPESKSSKILDFFKQTVKEAKKDKVKPLTKIVIRRLPPRLTKDEFLSEFTLPPHDFFYIVRGDLSMGVHSFSRVYVNLTNSSDTFAFKEQYDDYELRDSNGKEYHAVVEWAPVQRVPKKNLQRKKIPKSGIIESDPKYIEFLEKLEGEKNNQSNTSEYFHETELTSSKEEKITTTPLLEYIKLKRQKKIDFRNEMRQKKRDAEKDRRKKEDEMRKAEKNKKVKDEKDGKGGRNEGKEDVKSENSESAEPKEAKSEKRNNKTNAVATEFQEKKIDPKSHRNEKYEKIDAKPNRKDERLIRKERVTVKISETTTKSSYKAKDNINVEATKEKSEDDDGSKGQQTSGKTTHLDSRKTETSRRVEPKSKFRYSEQRKDREVRNQKVGTIEDKADSTDDKKTDKTIEPTPSTASPDLSKEVVPASDGEPLKRANNSVSGKDPRSERRIRNKDRPSLEIYRPGMGKFSKQRLEQKKDDSEVAKPSSSSSSKGSPEPEDLVLPADAQV